MKSDQLDLAQVVPFLRNTVLFRDADDEALKIILGRLEFVRFHKGDPIVLENEISDHVYFLFTGTVEVVKNVPELNQVSRLAILKPGDQFSEFSVLNRSTKGASVFALEDCELLRMSGDTFLEVLNQLPAVAKSLAVHIAHMTQSFQNSRLNIDYVQPDRVGLYAQIPQILPPPMWRRFEVLPIRFEYNSLYVAMKNPHNPVFFDFIRQRFPNLQIYISLIGNNDFELLEKELTAGYSDPANNQPKPVVLPAPLKGTPDQWLRQLSIFRNIPADWFATLAEHLSAETFKSGQSIYARSQPSEKLYIVHSGVVAFSLSVTDGATGNPLGSIFIGSAQPGDHFAELSLLNKTPHALTAKAATDALVYSLPKEIFDRLLETPYMSVPLACDLALQFQSMSRNTLPMFDEQKGVQVAELANLLPKSLIDQYEILPLRLKDNELTIGITNGESDTLYSVISRYLQEYRVRVEIMRQADFRKWIAELNKATPESTGVTGRASSANFARADAVTVLNTILEQGFNGRVSDVHIEPQTDFYTVRYRIDGVLHEGAEKFSKQLGAEILNRIKILSQIDMTQKFTPQDGQLKIDIDGAPAFARVSTVPTKRGEKAVLRLIKQKNSVPPLSAMVPDRRIINIMRDVVNTRQGVFLVTGPTGSGKSTTLYSLLRELNRIDVNILTLEDPVEMEIAGTNQIEINEKTGLTFSTALRSALRQDPNVIMIGEIRDEDSAKIAFHAASTGHLVLSTLHTNDSLNVIPRLLELGVSKGAIASTLIGSSAQRLLRKICGKCIEMRPITAGEIETLTLELPSHDIPKELAHGKGCGHCGHSGYHGRMPIVEAWFKSKPIENLLSQPYDLERLITELRKEGFETLRQFAFKMAAHGLTTLAEVHRAVGGTVGHTVEPTAKKIVA